MIVRIQSRDPSRSVRSLHNSEARSHGAPDICPIAVAARLRLHAQAIAHTGALAHCGHDNIALRRKCDAEGAWRTRSHLRPRTIPMNVIQIDFALQNTGPVMGHNANRPLRRGTIASASPTCLSSVTHSTLHRSPATCSFPPTSAPVASRMPWSALRTMRTSSNGPPSIVALLSPPAVRNSCTNVPSPAKPMAEAPEVLVLLQIDP